MWVLVSQPAFAGPAEDDEPLISPWAELDPRYEEPDVSQAIRFVSPLRAPIWVGVGGSIIGMNAGEPVFGAMVMLGLPLERLAARGVRAGMIAEGTKSSRPPPPFPKSADTEGSTAGTAPVAPARPPLQPGEPPPRIPVVITSDVARAAVNAALRRAHLLDPTARADDLAARARSAAGLPELRLRVLRTVDSGQALSPTEYDPLRTTDQATIAFWLEARATWRLDRLVFAEEEVALERMRDERMEAQTRLTSHVLHLLFEWQRALALLAAPQSASAPPEERLAAALRQLELEAQLDLETDGWFARWRGQESRHRPRPGPVATPPPPAP
jgi:hypothetical protein